MKTKAREVNWTPLPATSRDKGCELLLTNSSVQVVYHAPLAEVDEIRFVVSELGPNGVRTPIGSFVAQEAEEHDEDFAQWQLLNDLYLEATKVVYHWDQVLDEVETAVNSTGRIGRESDDPETSGRRGGGLVGPSRSLGGIR